MARINKKIITGLSFILIIIVLLVSIPKIINPNNYKSFITQEFKAKTGRELILNGNLQLKLFPNIQLHVDNLKILNPNNLPNGDLLNANSINLSVPWSTIFSTQNIELSSVSGSSFTVNLLQDRNSNNWTFANASQTNPLTIIINKVYMNSTSINYRNIQQNKYYAFEKTNIKLNTNGGQSIFTKNKIELNNTNLNIESILNITLNTNLDNESGLHYAGNIETNQLSLPKLAKLFKQPWPKALNYEAFKNITFAASFNGDAIQTKFDNIRLKINQSTVTGAAELQYNPFRIQQNIKIDKLHLNQYIDLNGFKITLDSMAIVGNLTKRNNYAPDGYNATEKITINNINLYGISIDNTLNNVNAYVESMGIIKKVEALFNGKSTITSFTKLLDYPPTLPINPHLKTNLGRLNMNMNISNGVITTPDTILINPKFKALTSGNISLLTGKINYSLDISLLSKSNQALLNSINLPYDFSGNLSHIHGGVNNDSVYKQAKQYYENKW